MPVVSIDSADDPRIELYRAVSEPALARERGVFVAEGRLVVSRVLALRRQRLHSVLLSQTAALALASELRQVDPSVPVFLAHSGVLSAIAGVDIHRGCLALAERPRNLGLRQVVESAKLVLVLEAIGNADNVGGIFRNAAAFGVDAVVLTAGCCDPFYRKAIRTSMAATLMVPSVSLAVSETWISELERLAFRVVGLSPDAAECVHVLSGAAAATERLALVLGSEGSGLSFASKAAVHSTVRIPMCPGIDSLNVAVASGIALAYVTQRSEPDTPSR